MHSNLLHFPQWNPWRTVLLLAAILCGNVLYAQDDIPAIIGNTDYKIYTDDSAAAYYQSLTYINDLSDEKPDTSTVFKMQGNKEYTYTNDYEYKQYARTYHEILVDISDAKGNARPLHALLLTVKNKKGNYIKTSHSYSWDYYRDFYYGNSAYHTHENSSNEPFQIKAYTDEIEYYFKKTVYDQDGNKKEIKLKTSSSGYESGNEANITYNSDSTRLFVSSLNSYNKNTFGSNKYKYILISYFGDEELEIGDLRILTDEPTVTSEISIVDDDSYTGPTTKTDTTTKGMPVYLCVKQHEDFGYPVFKEVTFKETSGATFGLAKYRDYSKDEKSGTSYYKYIPALGEDKTFNLTTATGISNTVNITVNGAGVVSNMQIFDMMLNDESASSTMGGAFTLNTFIERMSNNGGSYSTRSSGDVIVDFGGKRKVKAIRIVYSYIRDGKIYGTTLDGATPSWTEIANIEYVGGEPYVLYLDFSDKNLESLRALKFSFSYSASAYEIDIIADALTDVPQSTTPVQTVVGPTVGDNAAYTNVSATDNGSPWLLNTIAWSTDESYSNSVSRVCSSGEMFEKTMSGLTAGTTYNYRITTTNGLGVTAETEGTFTTPTLTTLMDLTPDLPYNKIHILDGPFTQEGLDALNNTIKKGDKSYGALMYDMTNVTFSGTNLTMKNNNNPNTFFIVKKDIAEQKQNNSETSRYAYTISIDQPNVIYETTVNGYNPYKYHYNRNVLLVDGYDIYNEGLNVVPSLLLGKGYYEDCPYPTCSFSRKTKAPWGTVCLPYNVDQLKIVYTGSSSYSGSHYVPGPLGVKGSNIKYFWWPTVIKAAGGDNAATAPDTVMFFNDVNYYTEVDKDTYSTDMTTWTDDTYKQYALDRPMYYYNSRGDRNIPEMGRRVAIVEFLMDSKGTYKASDGTAYTTGTEMTAHFNTDGSVADTLKFSDAIGTSREYTFKGNGEQTCYLTGSLVESTVPQDKYYLPAKADKNGNTNYDNMRLHRAKTDKTLPACRAYITIPSYEGEQKTEEARSLVIVFAGTETDENGNTTEVKRIATDEQIAEIFNIYSIDGQLVRRNNTSTLGLPRGLYIINGKKVVVK